MWITLLAFLMALLLTLLLVPVLSRNADKWGLVDQPDDSRKLHKTAIPMVGGLAVFVSALAVSVLFLYWNRDQLAFRPSDQSELIGFLVGASILLVVGLLDDMFGIRGRQKLIGQIIAVTALIASGFEFRSFEVYNVTIDFGIFAVLVVYLWMLAAINSINLLDGADGFATTIGLVMCLALGVMAVYLGKRVDAVIAVTVAGALLGFLRFNFPPARAFLGDHGSMLIGFILGALAIRCSFKQQTAYAFFAPVAILAIPFIDTSAAIIRRRLTGRSIYTVDRGHLHHRLQKQGYGPRTSLLWVALLSLTTALGGVIALVFGHAEYALVSIALVILVLLFGRIFGLAEFRLVSNKAMSIGRSFVRVGGKKRPRHQSTAVQLQGSQDWQEIWKRVCQFAESHELVQITMDLNVPWLHESFHATQRRSGASKDGTQEWYSQMPLVVGGRVFGRIEMIGDREGQFTYHKVIEDLLVVTRAVEQYLAELETIPVPDVAEIPASPQLGIVGEPDPQPLAEASSLPRQE